MTTRLNLYLVRLAHDNGAYVQEFDCPRGKSGELTNYTEAEIVDLIVTGEFERVLAVYHITDDAPARDVSDDIKTAVYEKLVSNGITHETGLPDFMHSDDYGDADHAKWAAVMQSPAELAYARADRDRDVAGSEAA